jgi:hypothetical protein
MHGLMRRNVAPAHPAMWHTVRIFPPPVLQTCNLPSSCSELVSTPVAHQRTAASTPVAHCPQVLVHRLLSDPMDLVCAFCRSPGERAILHTTPTPMCLLPSLSGVNATRSTEGCYNIDPPRNRLPSLCSGERDLRSWGVFILLLHLHCASPPRYLDISIYH